MADMSAGLDDRFKDAFREHPGGIEIVSAMGSRGSVGRTVSSVASAAVDPPTLVFSVSTCSGSAGQILLLALLL